MGDRLKGKVALVSGAGSSGPGWGNGKAAAVLFAREGQRSSPPTSTSMRPLRPSGSSKRRAASARQSLGMWRVPTTSLA